MIHCSSNFSYNNHTAIFYDVRKKKLKLIEKHQIMKILPVYLFENNVD